MKIPSAVLFPLVLLLGTGTVEAQTPPSPAPKVQFLYTANITVGLPVDVGAIPAGNVTVIPVIGGAILGPKISGKMLALGADWGMQTTGFYYSDMRALIRTNDNSHINVQMSGLQQGSSNTIYVRTTFQTGSKDYWWLNYAFAFGTMRPSGTGYVVDMWQMAYT
ncbi:hypothetical protein QBC39DRAFT_288506 [Podospora conica]|nr:hypothetical protein QBC39DRAFT_288506 [Schizothecium conicum]